VRVHSATLAGGDNNQDRLFVTENAVIVLDGASAFEPVDVDPGLYAETIGAVIAEQLDRRPAQSVADAVAAAISHAVQKLALTAGRSPSSTVSILRHRPDAVDLYVLGDSPVHYGTDHRHQVLADERLSAVASAEREHYLAQLRAGQGYGPEHRGALVQLQHAQHHARNHAGGYWIAETAPDAARHGLTTTLGLDSITWAVLATDGAADLIDHAGPSWPTIAHLASDELAALLRSLDQWETAADPDGIQLPRAKQHDDKTIVAATRISELNYTNERCSEHSSKQHLG
jgi:hypothetical protein